MHTKSAQGQKGSALVVVMIIMAVLVGLCAFMLEDSMSKMSTASGALESGKSFHLAEGGIDLGLADLNAGNDGSLGTDMWDPTTDDANGNGRPDFGENNVAPFSSGSGQVITYCIDWSTDGVDNDGINGIDDSGEEGYHLMYCAASDDSRTKYGSTAVLEVILVPIPTSLFRMAMFGDVKVDCQGNPMADSYDSDLGTYASQKVNLHAGTGVTYALGNGDLGSNMNIGANGAVKVIGKATPGPTGSVSLVGGAYVDGSTAPAPEPVALPAVTYNPPIASSGAINGNTTLNGGTHRYDSIKLVSSKKLTINGDVVLYIDGDMKMTASAEIEITPGSKLTLYHGSGTADLMGHGLVNNSKIPGNFLMKSATTDVLKFAGTAEFYGAVYAPDADVRIQGTVDTYGAFVGEEVTFQGNADFHYDEALGRIGGGTPKYKLRSWRQLQ